MPLNTKKDRAKIITRLEREKLIYIDKQNNNSVDKNNIYSISYQPKKLIKEQKMSVKKDTSMTLEKSNSLEHKSPEELAEMAQELLKLSEAKKQEIIKFLEKNQKIGMEYLRYLKFS